MVLPVLVVVVVMVAVAVVVVVVVLVAETSRPPSCTSDRRLTPLPSNQRQPFHFSECLRSETTLCRPRVLVKDAHAHNTPTHDDVRQGNHLFYIYCFVQLRPPGRGRRGRGPTPSQE